MLSDGFDLHRCLSLEKDGGEISDFSHDRLKRGKWMARGGQSVLSFHHNNSAKMSERLARLLRIAQYSPES
jgi:hypothetical protein